MTGPRPVEGPVDRAALDATTAAGVPAEVVAPDLVVSPAGPPATAGPRVLLATPVAPDDVDVDGEGTAVDPDSAAAAEPRGLRVRGWAGRGPVSLRMVKAPRWLRNRERRTGAGWVLWRLVSGAELDGKVRTNATWWRFGTKAFAWSERAPSRWAAYPRALRAAARWALAGAVAVVVVAWRAAPTATAWTLGTLAWLALAAGGWAAVDSLLLWPHRRRRVQPLHQVLAPLLGYPERTPWRRYIYAPPGYARPGGQVEIALPPDLVTTDDDNVGRQIANAVRTKLPLADATESWRLVGRNHFLIMRPRFHLPTPAQVWALGDPRVRELIEAQPGSAPMVGCAGGWVPVATNYDTDAPHTLLSVGSGGGKSETLKGLAAQLMHNGCEVWILDYKFTSHEWARGIARIARDIEAIHIALVELARIGEGRNRAAEAAAAAGEHRPWFRRLALLVEEANMTIKLLKLWWDTNRRLLAAREDLEPDELVARYGDPSWKTSPAIVALLFLMSMGRERRMHVLLVAQLATANALGGPEIREQFHSRILGRATAKAWSMLAPEIQPAPVCSRHRGRLYVVVEGRVIETQGARWTDAQARAWATEGVAGSRGREHTGVLEAGPRPVAPATPSGDRELIDIRIASTDEGNGLAGTTHNMLRKLRATDPEFPRPVQESNTPGVPHLYDPEDLRLWAANRGQNKGKNR